MGKPVRLSEKKARAEQITLTAEVGIASTAEHLPELSADVFGAGSNEIGGRWLYPARRLPLAALAPSLPKAARVEPGRCAIVFFLLAAVAALLMFFRAAAFCLALDIE